MLSEPLGNQLSAEHLFLSLVSENADTLGRCIHQQLVILLSLMLTRKPPIILQ